MAAILIESNNPSNLKLIAELAKKLGEQVSTLSKSQQEDIAFGKMMEAEKTGKAVSREAVMAKLQQK
jgi:hypothetical protein